MNKKLDKLLSENDNLVQSNEVKVTSHVQREAGDWIVNTLMIESYDVPFKFKRKRRYKTLNGALVNLTYYPTTENVAGLEMEIMNVVRVKTA